MFANTPNRFSKIIFPRQSSHCWQFVLLCRNFNKAKVQARLQQIEECIERYLSMLDTIDRAEPAEAPAKTARLQDKITHLNNRCKR